MRIYEVDISPLAARVRLFHTVHKGTIKSWLSTTTDLTGFRQRWQASFPFLRCQSTHSLMPAACSAEEEEVRDSPSPKVYLDVLLSLRDAKPCSAACEAYLCGACFPLPNMTEQETCTQWVGWSALCRLLIMEPEALALLAAFSPLCIRPQICSDLLALPWAAGRLFLKKKKNPTTF